MSANILFEEISKSFGSFRALDRVSFSVDRGTFLTVLGPSGSGKSTSLRIIGGFEQPDAGRVVLDGEDITDLPPERRDVNTTFQGYALFPHMTVFQNVAFGLETKRVARREIESRVAEALALVRLDDFARRSVLGLSGGEQQRVALARSFVNRPKVLLLDEPLGALDLKLRRQMQVELKRLQRTLGITFIYVTHDQEEALSMSDKIIVMNRGRIEQTGTPDEIYRRPATAFVADFLGEANIIEGEVRGIVDGSHFRVAVGGREFVVAQGTADEIAAGAPVLLSLRSEDVRLGDAALAMDGCSEGTIEDSIFLGNAWEFNIDIGEGLRISAWLPSREGGRGLTPGQALPVAWSPDDMVIVR